MKADLAALERRFLAAGWGGKAAGLSALLNMEQKYLFPYALPVGLPYDPERLADFQDELGAALKRAARSPRALALRGRLARLLGRKEAALADLDLALELDPVDVRALGWRGELLVRLGKRELGLGDLDNAMRIARSDPWPALWAAQARLAANETDAGLEALGVALAADPDCVPALLLRGRVRLERREGSAAGGPRLAAADFGRAARLDPACAAAHILQGRALAARGDPAAARCFAAATRLDPDAKAFYGVLVSGEGLLENSSAALAALDAFVRRNPGQGWALALRGDLKRTPGLGRVEEGVADLERATRLEPGTPWIRACLGRARVQGFDRERGLEDLERAAAMDPRCGWLRMWRGEAFRRLGRPREALADFRAALRLSPRLAQARLWQGRLLCEGKRFEGGAGEFTRAIRLDPGYGFAYAKRGEALLELGRPEAAAADLDRALNLKLPNNQEWAHKLRSRARFLAGDYLGAFADLGQAIRLDLKQSWVPLEYGSGPAEAQASGPAVLEALHEALEQNPNAGWLYGWRGAVKLGLDRLEGLSDLELCARISPAFAWARAWRGRVLWQTGRGAEGAAELDAALALEAFCPWLWAWRAECALSADEPERAAELAGRALGLWPRCADAHYCRGEARRRQGRLEEAEADLGRAVALDGRHKLAYVSRGLARGARKDFDGQLADFRTVARLAPELFRKTLEGLRGRPGFEDAEQRIMELLTPDPKPEGAAA